MTFTRYRTASIVLHWLIAALLITNIGLAWYFETLPRAAQIPPIQLHKSFGITILLLSLARLGVRFIWPPPPLPEHVKGWERLVARAVYVLFYVIMIGMPLTGWAMTSASRLIAVYPITLFGLVPWPAIAPLTHLPPDQMTAAHELFETAHKLLAKAAYGLVALHVGAALNHHFFRRDEVLSRMVPFLKPRSA